ncbi:MAG: hypothetical protein IKQ07_00735, partial [Bacteroidaceae bacterium]|nr:hypothetical protein [Bacteroidaceae bacterium]
MKKTILSKCFLHGVLLTLAFCLFPVMPACAQEDIVDRLDKALGVTLPSEYRSKVKEFVANDTIMRTRSATQYTEEFIKDEMKKDWGISKQNQLLFMWSKIYGGISQAKLYNWLDDENTARGNEYKKALRPIADFYMEYKTGFKAYMEEKSAEYERQSAEAKRQSAEAVQTSNMITYYGLYQITSYYQLRGVAPESETTEPNEFWNHVKEYWEHVANNCEKFNIDYRSLLPLEVQK